MIRPGIHLAETEAEKQAVYRFRYDVYVEEMGRYGAAADHENRLLVEPEDATARIFYAVEGGEVVATSRFSWGGDAPFSERLIEHYQLAPFLAELPADIMAVGERGMVVPRLRGSEIFRELGRVSQQWVADERIQLIFGACEPHLLSLYVGQGCRTFAKKNVNSAEAGYLIPIVTVVEDVEYLRRIGSPNAETAHDYGADARIPECIDRLVDSRSVTSQRLTSARAYLGEVHGALEELAQHRISALDGLDEAEAERALGKSNILHCSAGDRVLKQGGVARNMFVVLDGSFEVRDGETLIRALSPGDVFGEMAFLLERPRVADVFAATDGRILSLSESTLRKSIDSDPALAAHLLLNISKMLCMRILQRG
jgi:CRP-like cAMP-binding protein